MKNFFRKLGSRKLWLAIAGVATGIAVALGADTNEIATVAGALTSLISAVAYIVTEGKVDAESVKNAVTSTQAAIDVITKEDEQ